jgi:ribulose-phosphate 3-epimerase
VITQRTSLSRRVAGLHDEYRPVNTGAGFDLVQTVVNEVRDLHARNGQRITVVGIDGPTAAGKSTLADAVAVQLRDAGLKTWTFQLDWALRDRTEREQDVAHLRRIGAVFEFEGELHMRLGVARDALESVARFNQQLQPGCTSEQVIALSGLYSRDAGGKCIGKESLVLKAGMVFIVEGHYTLRNELDALIDYNLVLLGDPTELLARKVSRVKGYRSPDDAVHYFWHTDLPSFRHHLARFAGNADLVVDNTDFRRPRVIGADAVARWIAGARSEADRATRPLEGLDDIPQYVFSPSSLIPEELSRIVTAAIGVVLEWDDVVGHYLRVALDEVDDDLETIALRATEDLNRDFAGSPFRCRLSHTDALYNVYHRKLPLTLGLEIHHADSEHTAAAVLAEFDRDSLSVAVFWAGGAKRVCFERTLGGLVEARPTLRDDTPRFDLGRAVAKLKVFVPTQFTLPAFLDEADIEPVFIGREQENISAAKVCATLLGEGGVWIHRFALHREIRFFQYCLDVEGVPSVHVGNYLIALKSSDPVLRARFRLFRREWTAPIDAVAVLRTAQDAYDQEVEREKHAVRAYVAEHCPHLAIKDGAIFGNIFDLPATDAALREIGALLRSPYRILRKRAVEFLDKLFPGFAVPTDALWNDVPEGAKKTLSLGEFTSLSSSIMAEIYLWLALRNEQAAVLGANVYDIRQTSLDARAFLEAAAERGCPIVLQCSLNAVGQRESAGGTTAHGYLKPENGVEDFIGAARRAARDLYLVSGKRPPLYGIGLDHVNVANDLPRHRAKRFLQHAIRAGGVTHVVLDGSDLFQLTAPGPGELARVYERMNEWVLDLMDSPLDTFLKDMEVCISELNYVGKSSDAYVPTTEDIRLFAETYNAALARRGFACHVARPKLFISNLGTCHHSTDEVKPWVERSREWRDTVKGTGFVSAVLHGTSHSHQDTLAASTVGCHKVNVAGDFLDTIVENLPERLSRTIQEGDSQPKKMLPAVRPEMNRMTEAEAQKLYGALKDHCDRILGTISSPSLSSMDAAYFQYKDYEFTDTQVDAIVAQVKRELVHLIPKSPRRVADSREGYAFAASMIEVPFEEFSGPVLGALWDTGIRYFHVDEGDGVFIPRRFSGVEKVRLLRERFPTAVIHTHLMVKNPHYPKDGEFAEIQQHAEAGTNGVAVHIRSCGGYREAISALKIIRRLKLRPGIVIETSDSVDDNLEELIRDQGLDWVVVMGVPIGYGGQVFQYSTLNRISRLHDLASRLGRDLLVECDGGLNFHNIELCRKAGGQLFSGWSIIKGQNVPEMQEKIRIVQSIISKGDYDASSEPAYPYGWSGEAVSTSRV